MTEALTPLKAGDQVHVRRASTWCNFLSEEAGIVLSDVIERGQTITLTADSIRFNSTLLATVDDEGAAVGRGAFPDDQNVWENDRDPLYAIERERRYRAARALPEHERNDALRKLQREMPAVSTQRSQDLYGGRILQGHAEPIPRERL